MMPRDREELVKALSIAMRPVLGVFSRRRTEEFLSALDAAGLVIVPVEATREMLDCGEAAHMPFGEMLAAWDAMLSASPFAEERTP